MPPSSPTFAPLHRNVVLKNMISFFFFEKLGCISVATLEVCAPLYFFFFVSSQTDVLLFLQYPKYLWCLKKVAKLTPKIPKSVLFRHQFICSTVFKDFERKLQKHCFSKLLKKKKKKVVEEWMRSTKHQNERIQNDEYF